MRPNRAARVRWRNSILDRLELLVRSPKVTPVLGGTHGLVRASEHSAHYALLQPAATVADAAQEYFVKDGHLYRGGAADAASPWRGIPFLLMRVGPTPVGSDPGSIQQLRRQHALIQAGATLETMTSDVESYQTKANRLRLTNRLASLYGPRGMQKLPAVTPIAIEVAADFQHLVQRGGELDRDFADRLTMMRDGLRFELGLDFPGVRMAERGRHAPWHVPDHAPGNSAGDGNRGGGRSAVRRFGRSPKTPERRGTHGHEPGKWNRVRVGPQRS